MLEPELLASIIRKHRRAAGLSQLQLAEMAGVGKTVVFETRIIPNDPDEVGPSGRASHGIDLEQNRLTGGMIHYTIKNW